MRRSRRATAPTSMGTALLLMRALVFAAILCVGSDGAAFGRASGIGRRSLAAGAELGAHGHTPGTEQSAHGSTDLQHERRSAQESAAASLGDSAQSGAREGARRVSLWQEQAADQSQPVAGGMAARSVSPSHGEGRNLLASSTQWPPPGPATPPPPSPTSAAVPPAPRLTATLPPSAPAPPPSRTFARPPPRPPPLPYPAPPPFSPPPFPRQPPPPPPPRPPPPAGLRLPPPPSPSPPAPSFIIEDSVEIELVGVPTLSPGDVSRIELLIEQMADPRVVNATVTQLQYISTFHLDLLGVPPSGVDNSLLSTISDVRALPQPPLHALAAQIELTADCLRMLRS